MAKGTFDVWRDLAATAARHAERQARTSTEVWFMEPGPWALLRYRFAYNCWYVGFRGFASWLAGQTRRATGIYIHPNTQVGRRCLLLGPGIIIGEASVIGDDATIEPGVVIASGQVPTANEGPHSLVGLPMGVGSQPVHPTIGKRVVLEAGAIVTGDVFIGDDVRILAGAVVSRDVPDGSVVVGSPGRIIELAHVRPDPDARAIQALATRLYQLEEALQQLGFAVKHLQGPQDQWRTHNPQVFGPISEVTDLVDGAGI